MLETDRTEVVHHGFRTMAEGRTVTTGWIGIGAMYAKLARTGHVRWLLLGCWDVLTLTMAGTATATSPGSASRARYAVFRTSCVVSPVR